MFIGILNMKEPGCKELIERYRENYGIAIYLNYLYLVESLIQVLPSQEMRRKALSRASRSFRSLSHITLITEKKKWSTL